MTTISRHVNDVVDTRVPDTVESDRSVRRSDYVWFAVGGALAGGLVELAARVSLLKVSFAVDRTFSLDPQAIWMAPLANLPLFLVAVGVLTLVVRREEWRLRAALTVVVALAALETALITKRVAPLSLVILALGVGSVATSFLLRWRAHLGHWARAVSVALLIVAVLGAGGWNLRTAIREWRALAALAPLPADAPNVLLLVLDTVGALELSAYGYPLPTTPTLERLAAEGIRFERAIATSPWTLPSHASMFTGLYPESLSVGWYRALDDRRPTLAERMDDAGYATGGFVGNVIYGSYLHGLDRGFIRYRDYPRNFEQVAASSTLTAFVWNAWQRRHGHLRTSRHKRGHEVTEEFLSWQRSLGSRPFFAFLNYFDAHAPYEPPAPYDTLFVGRQPRATQIHVGSYPDSATIRDLRLAHNGGIRAIDAEIARLLDVLQARGVLDNTLIIVTADHGEEFGEHGIMGHGNALYFTQVRVPLLVVLPRRTIQGVVVEEPVSLRNLPATVLDVIGAKVPPLPGASLAPRWTRSGAPHVGEAIRVSVQRSEEFEDWYPVAHGDISAVLKDGWYYIAYENGSEELFRVQDDPLQLRNLATDPATDSVRSELRRLVHPGGS